MNDQQSSGQSSKLRDLWERNQDLLRNAGSLAATTGLTSIFGFVFTIVAARSFSPNEVGWGNAAINAMQLFGTIGMFGLNTMLIGELPKRARDRGGLFAASMATSAIGSAVLGLIFAVIVGLYFSDAHHLPGIGGTPAEVLLFVVGTALTGTLLVFDEGTIGLLRGGVQLWRNMSLSALKLVALPVMAFLVHSTTGVGISLAYVIGMVGSIVPAYIMLARSGTRLYHRPDFGALRRLLPVAINHNWLNLAMATPSRIIPIVVTVVVGGDKSAVFYVTWMITALLFMVPVHLGTVLFALASASPQIVAEKLRFVLRISLLIGLPVMAVLAISAHFMLGFYDTPRNHYIYSHLGTIPLWLLVIGYIPQMPRAQFIAVSRATNRVGQAAGLICFFATCEIASIFIGGKYGGLNGLSFAYLGVLCMEGLITAPTVLRAAYAHTAAATGAFPAVSTGAMPVATGAMARVTGELVKLTGALTQLPGAPARQDDGLAALFAIASAAVASDGHTLDVATEVWRTGSFPAIPADATEPRKAQPKVPQAATSLDMFGGRPAATRTTELPPPDQLSYRHRQQAGIDALIAMSTPVFPPGQRPAESRREDEESLVTKRDINRS